MDNNFVGIVRNYIDKSGTKKSDGTPFTAWAIVIEEIDAAHPDSIVADYYGEKLTPPEVGATVKIGYNIRSSEWNGKYFGQNNIWRLDLIARANSGGAEDAPAITPTPPTITPTENAEEGADPKSDLPF
jgi:hypothetical protein